MPSVSSLVSRRIFREKQYAERRLKDFDDALTREAVRDENVHIFLSFLHQCDRSRVCMTSKEFILYSDLCQMY